MTMRALAITAIISVAVIMGMSTVAPAMAIPDPRPGGPLEGALPTCQELYDNLIDAGIEPARALEIVNHIKFCSEFTPR